MVSPRRRTPLDLGECSNPVRFAVDCINPGVIESERRYAQGVVIDSHVDTKGNIHYVLDIFDMPSIPEQVGFARKICGIEGAVFVNDRENLIVDVDVLRDHLSPEEYTMYCRLANSDVRAKLMSLISLARLEGQEGHESTTTVLDRYAQAEGLTREAMSSEALTALARAIAGAL